MEGRGGWLAGYNPTPTHAHAHVCPHRIHADDVSFELALHCREVGALVAVAPGLGVEPGADLVGAQEAYFAKPEGASEEMGRHDEHQSDLVQAATVYEIPFAGKRVPEWEVGIDIHDPYIFILVGKRQGKKREGENR